MATRTAYVTGRPGFVVDHNSIVRNDGRQIDWAAIGIEYSEGGFLVTAPSGAAAAAVSIVVSALPGPVKAGTVLNFTGAGEAAIVTADAAAGATSIAVEALDAAIEAGDTAPVAGTGAKRIKAGTVMGELAGSGKLRPRVVTTNPATCLLATDAVEGDRSAATSGYGTIIGGAIYESLLPDATGTPKTLAAAIKTELDAARAWFSWETYTDDRP